ncbi:MAG: hypothetical protein KC964_24945, partial [Candidatus Omnitrophica bacterium]|nr:hypothetical protein [Candidatus Omnitrophota bacterium]
MPTPISSHFYRIVLLMVVWFPLCANAQNDREEFRLFPGESYTSMEVTVTWRLEGDSPVDILHFQGPKTEVSTPRCTPPCEAIPPRVVRTVFLDGVAMEYTLDPSPSRSIYFRSYQSPTEVEFDARPDRKMLFVSRAAHLEIGSVKLTVSNEPVEFATGTAYLQISAKDMASEATCVLPLALRAQKSIGRYSIEVVAAYPETKTAKLEIIAEPDFTVQGKEAWITESCSHLGDLETILSYLGENYGFEVEWQLYDNYVESAAKAKRSKVLGVGPETPRRRSSRGSSSNSVEGATIRERIDSYVLDFPVSFEWKTPTLLSVYPMGFKEVLKEQEEQRLQDEKKQKAKELNEAMKKEFEEKYQPILKVYSLKSVTPITAKAIIDQELQYYSLRPTTYQKEWPVGEPSIESIPIAQKDEWFGRASDSTTPNYRMKRIDQVVAEECIADDKANAIIVTAIPETHKKIEELLAKMEGVLEAEQKEKAAPLQLYKVEVALLQSVNKPTSATPEYMEKLNQPIEDLSVDGENITEVMALISEYTGVNINVEAKAISPDVTFKIVQPTPAIEVLRLIADANGLRLDFQPSTVMVRWADGENTALPVDPADYGLKPEDLKQFKVDSVSQLGHSIQSLTNSPDSNGTSTVMLGEEFQCELAFQDFREPYLILNGKLQTRRNSTLIQSTLFLEPDTPSVLAI